MTTAVGQWLVSYTAGDWLLLGGPTSAVVLEPRAAEPTAEQVRHLWVHVLAASSIHDVAARLAGLLTGAEPPRFAAFFWEPGGLRCLVRGVSVLDLDRRTVVASGDGVQTWTEVDLADVTRVGVDPPGPPTRDVLTLPLVVGAVRASSVILDATPSQRAASVQETAGLAARDAEPDRPAQPEPEPEHRPGPDASPAASRPTGRPAGTGRDGTRRIDEAALAALENGDTVALPAVAPAPGPPGPPPGAAVPVAESGPPSVGLPKEAPAPGTLRDLVTGDTSVLPPPPGSTEPTEPIEDGSPRPMPGAMVLAVICPVGHANPVAATHCWICRRAVPLQQPRPVPQPPLALLRVSIQAPPPLPPARRVRVAAPTGHPGPPREVGTAVVDRAVLIGRAPGVPGPPNRGDAAPRLLTVPSPGGDISRTHVEVRPEDWQVVVTDLRSTNGTLVNVPGGTRLDLEPGRATPVPLGSVLELGDGVSVLLDFPQ